MAFTAKGQPPTTSAAARLFQFNLRIYWSGRDNPVLRLAIAFVACLNDSEAPEHNVENVL